jgi:integrase
MPQPFQLKRSALTDLFVKSIKSPQHGQHTYWDGGRVPGFGLRVSQGGTKTWILAYRRHGRTRWLKLATYPTTGVADARDMAKAALAKVERGIDPADERRQDRDDDATFSSLCRRYLDEHAKVRKKPKSAAEDGRMICTELLPRWGSWNPAEIQRRHVIELVDGIATRGAPIAANRVLALVSVIFAFAVDKEIVAANPAYRVRKPGAERSRERHLSDDELIRVCKALEEESPHMRHLFRLLILTGQRKSEVAELPWRELEINGADIGWWILPGQRAKNHITHRIPLVEQALDAIRELLTLKAEESYVFPGGKTGQPIRNLAKALKRIRKRSGVDFHIHDLRRSCATGMARLRVSQADIDRVMNHIERGSRARIHLAYNKYQYDKEKIEALRTWDDYVRALASSSMALQQSA